METIEVQRIIDMSGAKHNDDKNHLINSKVDITNGILFADHPKYIGNCRVFLYKGLNPRIVIGPQWFCYIGTSIFISVIYLSVIILLFSQVTFYGTVFGVLALVFQVISYMLAAIMNPGLPNRELTKFRNTKAICDKYPKLAYCRRCGLAIVNGSHTYHCDECGICVESNNYSFKIRS